MFSKLMTMKGAGIWFMLTWTLHTGDHIRRGTQLTSDGVLWGGTTAAMLISVAMTLIYSEHPLAAFSAVAVFGAIAVGVSATHLAPAWGYFSEPLLFDSEADRWAIWAVLPEIVAAGWLAWIAFGVLRNQNFQVSSSLNQASN